MEGNALEMFVMGRLAELDEAEKTLREKLTAIGAEKEKLKKAVEAVTAKIRVKDEPEKPSVHRQPLRLRGMTLQAAVIEILKDNKFGLPAAEILKEINSRHKMSFARESLSPQISRLKQAGRVEQSGRIWKLADQHPTKINSEEGNDN